MALILEIRDQRGHVTWHPLDRLPVTLGRALTNDIIVDDPYVDAIHARISLSDDGMVVIEDTGTVNGIVMDQGRTAGPVRLGAGIQLRMGRTSMRVRARDEAVPPALHEVGDAALPMPIPDYATAPAVVPHAASAPGRSRLGRWADWALETTRGRLITIGAVLVSVGLSSMLSHTEDGVGMTIFGAVLVTALLLLVWSSIWALATRGADRRVRLMAHLAVAALVTLVMIVFGITEDWLRFLFPDAGILDVMSWGTMTISLTWLVAAHLAVPRVHTRRKRWRVGAITAAVFVGIVAIGLLLGDDEFSDVPEFSKQLKRLPAAMVPANSTAQFLDVMHDVKARADEAATTPD